MVLRIKTNTQNIQKSIIVNPAKSIIANLDVVVNLNVDVVKYQYYNYVAILARNIYFIHCTYIDAYHHLMLVNFHAIRGITKMLPSLTRQIP